MRTDETDARSWAATQIATLAARLDAAEARSRTPSGGVAAEDVAAAVKSVADDLARLREAHVRDAQALEARLWDVERRIEEMSAVAALRPRATESGPLTEQEEGNWVTLARDGADGGQRFSALSILGRTRTDRSLQASVRALADPDERVVWQGLRNLGRWKERSAAREIAGLVGDARVTIRSAAYDALRAIGAPDVGFDPAAPTERRRGPADRLRAWAEDV